MRRTVRWRAVRTDERWRWAAMVASIAVGLVAASVHWSGLFLGGSLVGLVSTTRKRALLSGLGFGVFVWVVFALMLFISGDVGRYLAMGQLLAVSVAIPIGTATFAASTRWLV